MKRDALDVLDFAYDLAATPTAWLRQLGGAVYERLGAGIGLMCHYYRVTPELRVEMGEAVSLDMPDGFAEMMRSSLAMLPPEFVQKSFVRCECTTQSDAADAEMRPLIDAMMENLTATYGWRDILMLGGMDPTGHAVYVGAWLPQVTSLPEKTRSTWSRVAVHVASAYRLRRRLAAEELSAPDSAEAVISANATVDHATGEAQAPDARGELLRAVRDFERARGRLRKSDPDEAVATWRGLASARWSLVEHFESDGKRYVLACRNDVTLGSLASLATRERQALAYAALGHSNKMIAYEMGISASTVGVLLHRAAKKLDAPTRVDLVRKYVEATRG